MNARSARSLLLAVVAVINVTSGAMADDVRYPIEAGRDIRDRLPFQVLELALAKADGDWRLVPTDSRDMNETRQKKMIAEGRGLDVGWFGTYAELEEQLMPVRIPIDGGLLGWRLMLIDGARQAEFTRLSTIEELRSLTLGQGKGWGDVPILEAAGLRVRTSDYENLFRMVGAGRIDAFPRGAHEAYAEHKIYAEKVHNLAVEESLVVHYPLTMLFFVRNGNHELHDAIYRGFSRAHDDGSYNQLFLNHPAIKKVLREAQLGKRRKIEIANPTMSAETLAIDSRYWFLPEIQDITQAYRE